MGALCDPIVSITYICRECGMEFSEECDSDEQLGRARAEYLEHVRYAHGNDEERNNGKD